LQTDPPTIFPSRSSAKNGRKSLPVQAFSQCRRRPRLMANACFHHAAAVVALSCILCSKDAQTFQRYFGRLGGSRSLSYLSHIDKYCQRVRLQAGCMPSLTVGGVDNDCAYSMQQAHPLSSGIEYSRQRQRHIHLCRLVTWLLLGFGNWRMTPLSYVSDVFTYIIFIHFLPRDNMNSAA